MVFGLCGEWYGDVGVLFDFLCVIMCCVFEGEGGVD